MTVRARIHEEVARAENGVWQTIRLFIRRYEGIHLTIGILGNACFFVGSILFLPGANKTLGVWLFIWGSAGMLLGSLGKAVVRYEERRETARRPSGQREADNAGHESPR